MTAYLLAAADSAPGDPARRIVVPLDAAGLPAGRGTEVTAAQLPALVAAFQDNDPACRWVWEDTRVSYPELLRGGAEAVRCHDLGLSAQILRGAVPQAPAPLIPPRPAWISEEAPSQQDSLFDAPKTKGSTPQQLAAEYQRQLAALPQGPDGAKLRLLMSLDSAGALLAAEMNHDGLPWDRATHEALLERELGPRVPPGSRPARLADLAEQLKLLLDAPRMNPDSQPELLRALRRAGIDTASTRKWDLMEVKHPVIEPLMRYKKLQRLFTANGWGWLDAWLRDGRFHPDYVVAGVVTGRWASHGGGALQIPHDVRSAVRADPGHVLVVADASQLEPRILAAISADRELAQAARGTDLYQAIADRAFEGDRDLAKVAMLGAMYGGTTGPSAAMAPRLAATFPRATAFLEEAARTGERGGIVRTWLGRHSPAPGQAGGAATGPGGALGAPGGGGDPGPDLSDDAGFSDAEALAARRSSEAQARSFGRFTRNFVVQGSAAEWAECWMASLRTRLRRVAPRSRQVFFLHDEIMVHAHQDEAAAVQEAMTASAEEAARLLFGDIPVDFPVSIGQAQDYASAK
ncbi:bifunctional 3'-5' exonuclease/DNA polymerase [Galactobacter caseinivorans]|uniref:DNA-directed DNA polymerase n=1 Tax=Galactobacter caseinivorans TaxID=2676123 RepID=A0A496PLA7_9MICC|nr:bifunctional 3'-5' exonuclease/DNA polymerase [Galactobacter caseinivorans]RKW71322.1 bifunctional 3'-5' exonuclease/DNA polymerase [Galactobacter caseinivorans]